MLGEQSIAHLLINNECLLFVRSLITHLKPFNPRSSKSVSLQNEIEYKL